MECEQKLLWVPAQGQGVLDVTYADTDTQTFAKNPLN